MRRIGVVWVYCLVTGLFWIPVASAQGEKDPEFSVGGLLFGDLYHVASFHTDEGEGATGLDSRAATPSGRALAHADH